MAHLLMYSTNYTALAEALTTSKAMVGRRLVACSDFRHWPIPDFVEGACNEIVNGITATWSAAASFTDWLAREAEAAATRTLNAVKAEATRTLNAVKAEAKRLAREAEAAATRTLNAVKAEAEKAANEATKFIDDVGNAFGELGDEIQSVFGGVEQLVLDVGAFAVKLGDDLVDFIGELPSPAGLMQLAIDGIREKLFKDNGLCLAPSCPGYHINSGVEEDLVP